MKRRVLALAVAALAGCGEPTAPGAVYPSYFLATVDGKPLPVPYGEAGTQLVAGQLDFGGLERPRDGAATTGLVQYVLDVQRPDHSIAHSTIGLDYAIEGGVLRINLCPPLALCFARTELIGPISPDRTELTLTHYLADIPGSVYRYVAPLRE